MNRMPAFRVGLLGLLWFCACITGLAQTEAKVSGLGFFGNIDMGRRVAFLSGSDGTGTDILKPRDVEDLAYIIIQQLKRDGFADPAVTTEIVFEDGREVSHIWTSDFQSQHSDELAGLNVKSVKFDCEVGILNYYNSLEIDGIKAMKEDTVRDFFLPSGVLFTRKVDLAFTEANLKSRLSRVLNSLNSLGYLQANVSQQDVLIDPDNGRVDVTLTFEEGPIHHVHEVVTELEDPEGNMQVSTSDEFAGEIFNSFWLRRQRQRILNSYHEEGYPDTQIFVERSVSPDPEKGIAHVDVKFRVRHGARIKLTGVRFEPEDLLKDKLRKRTVGLDINESFNLLKVEEGRRNLLSLGVLNDVDLQQVPVGPNEREVVYTMTPANTQNLHLLAGWGSYEQARVGLRWEQLNIWNLAHRYELDAVQSMKSTNVDLTYIIPHFFQREITGYARAGYEFREEISYDRSTSTMLLGVGRRIETLGIDLSLEYSLEGQKTERDGVEELASKDEATVASLSIRGVLDRRDSALYPTTGYDASITSKSAAEFLGGNSNFQKLELTASYHRPLLDSLFTHLSLRYGGIFSKSPASENLPFNERFFLGGENTVRGYIQGEASPISSDGQLTGAETYLLANVEFEQRVFSILAVVAFWDGLAQMEILSSDSDIEYLNSVGAGIRLRTPIGPIRLEYGHNLNPRPTDPDGTLHFSVGFPF